MMSASKSVTQLLKDWSAGDRQALSGLLPLIYGELRRLAEQLMRGERAGHTLQPTALVHEAYIALADSKVDWTCRAHFFGAAARLMRRILVDHARARKAAKRDGGRRITMTDALAITPGPNLDVILLDDALRQLTSLDAQQGRIVELRFFGGLSIEETAEVLSISPATVKRDWVAAKAWLRRNMQYSAENERRQ